MHKLFYLLIPFALFACKKEIETHQTSTWIKNNLAPCTLEYTSYDYDSVFYSPSPDFPHANYRIKFGYNSGFYTEFGFEEFPTTGIYYQVKNINPSWDIDQVAFKQYYGAYGVVSTDYVVETIYIDANADRLIISSCNMDARMANPQTWQEFSFSQVTLSLKLKKEF